MVYQYLRSLLFYLPPETAHRVALTCLQVLPRQCFPKPSSLPVQALGMGFPHPVGLAAGFDKDGRYIQSLFKLGFSFIEVGTVTPKPQVGNPKPRLFRLPEAQALINRMGFNNLGVDVLVTQLQRRTDDGILGVNIGKNKDTPLAQAVDDYLFCLRKVYAYASYVTINISSPNTPQLKQLQQVHFFKDFLHTMKQAQDQLADQHQCYVPMLVKVSPDESVETLKHFADTINHTACDGVIVTNTTTKRDGVRGLPHATETGGLSGQPLFEAATNVLTLLKTHLSPSITVIASGGIDSADAAQQKMKAGADLLQLYTGLIYKGPRLIHAVLSGLKKEQ